MNTNHMRVAAHINLDNIIHNLTVMHDHIGGETDIVAVIKTNGYGHGAVAIAKRLEEVDFIHGYAVATIEEGIELRDNNCNKPILILGYVFHEDYGRLVKYNIMPSIFTYEDAYELNEAAKKQNTSVKIHIKLDTGMHRIGFLCEDNSVDDICRINQLSNIELDGIFTHFSKADETDKVPTHDAYNRFANMITKLEDKGVSATYVHCGNSAAIIDFPEYKCSLMRAGITTYGLWPSNEVTKDLDLRPALSLISHVSYVKTIAKGEPISYGGTYITSRESTIATVPVGYGDGYPRSLSNNGYVLINGFKAPITGRVCMDQFMVDVTDVPDVKQGTKVTLIGCDGNNTITAEELGDLSGRFNYELVCDINSRVPRVFS